MLETALETAAATYNTVDSKIPRLGFTNHTAETFGPFHRLTTTWREP